MSREVPEGWRRINLSDVAKESRIRNTNLSISAERLVGVFKEIGMLPMRQRVRGASVERCKIVKPSDFAYNPMRINIGSIARSTADDNMMVSPDYVVFSLDRDQIDGQFLDFVRKSDAWAAFIGNAGDGGVRIRIYFEHLAHFSFNLPPLSEQRRITEVLSSVDDAIAATQAVIEQTKKVKQATLERLLTKGIGHTRFKQTEIGKIPEEWQVLKLGDIAMGSGGLQTGPFGSQLKAEEYVESGVPVVMPRDLILGSISFKHIARITLEKAAELSKHVLKFGDIVFARRGDIGRCAIVSKDDIGILCGTGCLRARLDLDKIVPSFAGYYLQSTFAIEWLNTNAVGQTMLNLNTSIISQLPFPLFNVAEQEKIVEAVKSFDETIKAETNKLNSLLISKSALMSDLLTGRKRVTGTLPLAAE